jgi:hypothetical protein
MSTCEHGFKNQIGERTEKGSGSHQNTSITSGVIATKSFLVVLGILLLLQVKSRCDSNLKIGKLLQQHKLVAITYNSSLH